MTEPKPDLFEKMKEVCDTAHEFARRFQEHKGRCRLCDEIHETLIAKLNELAEVLDD